MVVSLSGGELMVFEARISFFYEKRSKSWFSLQKFYNRPREESNNFEFLAYYMILYAACYTAFKNLSG